MSAKALPAAPDPWTTVLDGRRLKHERGQRGLSQEELADLAGISLSTLARLERRQRASCRCRTLGRLATALGIEPADLTRSPEDPLSADVTPSPGHTPD